MNVPHSTIMAGFRATAHTRRDYLIAIPGVAGEPFRANAQTSDEALRDALHHYGMHFAPPGTTVTLPAGGPV